jgi:ubiquinone biosynthesis protein
MKITAIPQFARNLNRMREITAILSKYGLVDWISRLNLRIAKGIFRSKEGRLADLTPEARIRLACTELGTTFIKFGQILSTRADLVGLPLATELSKLQANVPSDPPEIVRSIVEKELGKPISKLFATFDDQPLASASIAQVHAATLHDGRRVVVKVQHPDIAKRIRNDLEILTGLAQLAEKYIEELQPYQPKAIVEEFEKVLTRELDFGRELRNLERFVKNFADDPNVRFPLPHPALSSGRVLTMDRLDGVTFGKIEKAPDPAQGQEIARLGARVFLEMIFRDSFYHADPHPGNLLLLPDGTIGILDVGMVGQLTPGGREDMEDLFLAIGSNNPDQLSSTLMRLCGQRGIRDPIAFSADVADFLGYYRSQAMNRLDISAALTEMTDIIRRHHLFLPTNIAMLLRVLILLEGTSRLLHPQFKLTEVIEPFQSRMVAERLSPIRQLRRFREFLRDWRDLATQVPAHVRDIVQRMQTGRIEVQLQHHHLEPSVNRLVLGIVTAALIVASSMLWANNAPPVIFGNVSVIGVLGFLTSILCAGRLILAVLRSGNVDT